MRLPGEPAPDAACAARPGRHVQAAGLKFRTCARRSRARTKHHHRLSSRGRPLPGPLRRVSGGAGGAGGARLPAEGNLREAKPGARGSQESPAAAPGLGSGMAAAEESAVGAQRSRGDGEGLRERQRSRSAPARCLLPGTRCSERAGMQQ